MVRACHSAHESAFTLVGCQEGRRPIFLVIWLEPIMVECVGGESMMCTPSKGVPTSCLESPTQLSSGSEREIILSFLELEGCSSGSGWQGRKGVDLVVVVMLGTRKRMMILVEVDLELGMMGGE